MRKIKEEETGSEEDNSFGVITLESSNSEDVWSFNHPHLSMKEHREKLCQVEVLVKKKNNSSFPRRGV